MDLLTLGAARKYTNNQDIAVKSANHEIYKTFFPGASLPTSWAQITGAGWTISNANALSTTDTKTDSSATLYYDKFSTLDRRVVMFKIMLESATSVFAIGFRNSKSGDNMKGSTLATIDFNAKALKLHAEWVATNVIPTARVTQAFTNITAGVEHREYWCSLTYDKGSITLKVVDSCTGATETLNYKNYEKITENHCGFGWGSASVTHFSGQIRVRECHINMLQSSTPKVAIYTDSLGSGYAIDASYAPGYTYDDRWAQKVGNDLFGDCLLSCKSGGNSTDLIARMANDLTLFNPKFVIVEIGGNDTDGNTLITNLTSIKTLITDRGAVPIFCTIPNSAQAQSAPVRDTWLAVNAAIRDLGNGTATSLGCTIIDLAAGNSIDNDFTKSYIADSIIADGTHLSIKGHVYLYNKVKIDAPFIFV